MVKNRATQPNSSIVCFMSVAVHVIEGVNKKGFFRQLNLTQLNIYIYIRMMTWKILGFQKFMR